MSRSYKKTPGWCDRDPFMKMYANRQMRQKRTLHIPNGNWYRKMSCSWNICDFKSLYFTEADLIRLTTHRWPTPRYKAYMK